MSRRDANEVEVDDMELVTDTDRAYLVRTADGDKVWLPKSQVGYDEDRKIFTMPEWLALEKGLI